MRRLTDEQRTGRFADSWKVVAQYFGSDRTEIPDNRIEASDRIHFYHLEDVGLMERHIEQVTIPEGNNGSSHRPWRIFSWRLSSTVTPKNSHQ
jgi:hypothetical protein